MQTLSNFFVVKDKEELDYLEGNKYIIWNDNYVKDACNADASHFKQFPDFLSAALEWKLILEKMYPKVQERCLLTYGYYTEKPIHYAIDRYIRRLITNYIIVKTDKNIELSTQLYWPEKAFREAYKDAYHRLSEYHKR